MYLFSVFTYHVKCDKFQPLGFPVKLNNYRAPFCYIATYIYLLKFQRWKTTFKALFEVSATIPYHADVSRIKREHVVG